MIKRMNKATSLLIAAAAVVSLIPATGASAADRLETKDGTIEKAVAFDGGKYLYEGYKSDNDDNGLYYNSGDQDKLLEDIQDADIQGEYADKYAYALDGSDEYTVDLSNGDINEDKTPEDDADTAATKLRTALKKTDRYGSTVSVSLDESSVLQGNKFGETWYSYSATPESGADGENNIVGTELYGFTNGSGKYIDASNVANIYAYSTEKGKMVKIENFSNDAGDVDEDTGLLATLAAKPEVLTQDADYIYAKVTVNITDTASEAIMAGTTTGAAVEGVTGTTTQRTFIQKISKAQGDTVDGAYVPKSVESYELLGADDQLDSDDAKDAATAIDNAVEVTVSGNQLFAIEVSDGDDNVKVTSIDLKKEKLEYLNDAVTSSKVDAYVAEKNDDDDIDADNASKAYDVDVNGNVWVVADGKVSEFKNNEFTDVYDVDSSLDSLNVYDENNLIAWEADGDIYTTVGQKTTDDTTTPVDQTPAVTAGWVKNVDGTWSFNKADGTKATGWVQDGAWYYLNANGIMQTGWVNDNGTWYFLNASGAMKTGWVNDNGTWYFLNASGAMKTGWVNDNGTWYFLKSSGAMATGWVNDNGTWYYLNASGAMLANTTVDGYKLGASGAWVK
jgi:glucan-binding YG repeat protein